jgi:hypothetical protein
MFFFNTLEFSISQVYGFLGESFLLSGLLLLLIKSAFLSPKVKKLSQSMVLYTRSVIVLLFLTFVLVSIFFMYYNNPSLSIFIFFDKLVLNYFNSVIKLFLLFSSAMILNFSIGFFTDMHRIEDLLEIPILIGFGTFFLLLMVSVADLLLLGLVLEGLSLIIYVLLGINFS